MCGIAGLYRPREPFAAVEGGRLVGLMAGRLVHRGPDAEGYWADPQGRCFLGHRRLSIIDVSDAGLQPFTSHDGRWVITFNGEIYNFMELRSLVQQMGGKIQGRTDTEALIESLALWGTRALEKLDGMFAFAAYDRLTGDLLLARDAFGEKPIYFMELSNGGIAFASELQALECVPGFDATIDLSAIGEFLCFQYVGAPRTIYRKVEKLCPGHWLRLTSSGERTSGCFYQFSPDPLDDRRPLGDLADELEDILVRSIRGRMNADVPIGAFLSGGADSSTVCALIKHKLGVSIPTYSIGFSNEPASEHETARAYARHLGTDHHDLLVDPKAVGTFIPKIGGLLDEPNADNSCLPSYLLSGLARQHIKVAIGGDGGDEMFAGYNRYLPRSDRTGRSRAKLTPGAAFYGLRLLPAQESHIAALFGFVPEELTDRFDRLRADLDDSNGSLSAMRRTDVQNYLPGAVLAKVDRMSMRHSLEVRTPYLNRALAEFAARLPESALVRGTTGKIVLREVARRYLPKNFVDLPKQGFGVPMSQWARKDLINAAVPMIEADEGCLSRLFGRSAIRKFIAPEVPHEVISFARLWSIATLESWLRHHPASIQDVTGKHGPAWEKKRQHPAYSSFEGIHESLDLSIEAAIVYAAKNRLDSFAIDGHLAGEYRASGSAHDYIRVAGRVVESTLVGGRPRVKAPFELFGHFICTDPRNVLGVFWCLDLLKSGYCFLHLPLPGGGRKVRLIEQLARNCLSRATRAKG